jgi:hypothetical protein
MKGGFKAMQSTSPYALAGLGAGGEEFTNELQRVGTLNAADRKELLKQSVDAEKADDARRAQMLGYGLQADTATKNKAVQMAGIKSNQETQNSIREEQLTEKANNNFLTRVDAEEKRILASAKYEGYTPDYIRALAYNNVVRDSSKQVLDRTGHTYIPQDKMPLSKPVEPPKEPDLIDRILGRNKTPAPAAAPAGPKVGDTKVIGNVTYGFDGQGWLPQ